MDIGILKDDNGVVNDNFLMAAINELDKRDKEFYEAYILYRILYDRKAQNKTEYRNKILKNFLKK